MTVTENDEQRQTLTNAQGVPVLTYLQGVREGHPWADLAEVVGPDPVESIVAGMSGWAVSGSVELGEQLLRRGAQVMRHAHEMRRDLVVCPPPADWSSRALGNGLRAVPCDLDAEAVFPAWRAAFPADHPDHHRGSDEEALDESLAPMLAGSVLGPVLPCSALVVDETDRVVAGAIITNRDGLPWIADVFRRPGARYAGLGANLLRRVLSSAAADGLADISLVVSDANPARRVYEKLGFQLTGTSLTVVMP
ncbi:GNAT family N-acetyltransferase [Streptomyces sp. NPDC014646]|uniref:GNAT family N-acetyltransferase n=1 Tax=unclassified Streptomyces TaxID=2593676 RepID=UPI0036FA7757